MKTKLILLLLLMPVMAWGQNVRIASPIGPKTKANSVSVTHASDDVAPLPTGAATAAKQDTGNTSLATLATSTGSILTTLTDGTQKTQISKFVGAPNYTNGQVTLSTTAGTLKAANTTRRAIRITNLDSTITVYIGAATVTAANGDRLLPGQSTVINATGLIQGIAASGSPVVAYWEEYD